MKIKIYETAEQLGFAAATQAAGILNNAIAESGGARLLVATGRSQLDTLKALVDMPVDWTKVEMFHLDEYLGMPETHPASFRKYLKERFVGPAGIKKAYYVSGEGNIDENIAKLTEEIRKAPIDLGLIGIGENAHIAFNDPPANFDTKEAYIVVDLDESCKKQQMGEGWFATLEEVPKRAVTMTAYQIMESKVIISCVPYSVKAPAVKKTIEHDLTEWIPATILKTHENWTLFLDSDSAALLNSSMISGNLEYSLDNGKKNKKTSDTGGINMKLAFTTLGNPDWSFEKTLEEAQRLGFDAIEIRGVEGKMLADEITQFFPENLEETQRKLIEHNLTICCFGSSVSFHDSGNFTKMIEEGKSAIDVCARMNIPYLRIFGDKITSDLDRQGVIQRIIEGIKKLCEYSADKNVKVLLEVHGDFNTVENIMGIIEEVKSCPQFGILWDVAHSDRTYGDNFMRFYSKIKPYIRHVHIKDHLRNEGKYDLCLVGKGDVPIVRIVKSLMADGYDGFLSFEWEKKWHPELEEPEISYPVFIDFMRNI